MLHLNKHAKFFPNLSPNIISRSLFLSQTNKFYSSQAALFKTSSSKNFWQNSTGNKQQGQKFLPVSNSHSLQTKIQKRYFKKRETPFFKPSAPKIKVPNNVT